MGKTTSQDTRRQVIVRFSDKTEPEISNQLAEWKKNGGTIKDNSIIPKNLYLLECNDEIARELIENHSMTVQPYQGIEVSTNGKHDDNPPDVDIDSDGNFKYFLNNEKMPPIANNTNFEDGLLNDIFDNEVTIYILDTGVTEYGWDTDNLMVIKKDKESGGERNYGYNYIPNNYIADNDVTNDFTDKHGHGTFAMKVITRGISNGNLKVVPLKIFNENGVGTFFDMICAMFQAISEGADIINLSAGFRRCIERVPSILKDVIDAAQEEGVFIVASAGNGIKKQVGDREVREGINLDETLKKHYPGSIESDNIISVASLEINGSRSKFSNYGENVSLATYGENIPSENGIQIPTGTSVAAFYTTKALAAVISKYKVEYKRDYKDKKIYIKEMRKKFDELMEDSLEEKKTARKYLNFDKFFGELKPEYTVKA